MKYSLHPVKALSFLILCGLLGSKLMAQDFGTSSNFKFEQTIFLPSEEAFQVSPNIDKRHITFNWNIVDKYYLYRNQFSLSAHAAGKSIDIELTLPQGQLKYDQAFEKELEVYYRQTTLSATLPDWEQDFELKLISQGCAEDGLCYPPRKQYFSFTENSAFEIDKPRFAETPPNS